LGDNVLKTNETPFLVHEVPLEHQEKEIDYFLIGKTNHDQVWVIFVRNGEET